MQLQGKSVLTDISTMLRTIRTDIDEHAEITSSTFFCCELGLTQVEVISLLGRLQGRYGGISLGPYFNRLSVDKVSSLQVGHVIEHVERLLDAAGPVPPSSAKIDVEPGPSQAIVISNGRSGSTMLSDLLAEQSETCVPQEFFRSVGAMDRFDEVISGSEYWALLTTPRPEEGLLAKIGLRPPEYRYPDDGRRSNLALPPILMVALPSISTDPDDLYDTLAQQVPSFPPTSVGRHHQRFLDLLCVLTGRQRWVERSGASTLFVPQILRHYPQAKIVYLTRNWADTARSMSRHPSFQLDGVRAECQRRYGVDPLGIGPDDIVPEEAQRYLPDRLTAQDLLDHGRDSHHYLWTCAYLTNIAEQALADAPPAHLHMIRYEDLLRDPVAELTGLGRFLEFDDSEEWAARVAGRVKQPGRLSAAVGR
jgi:putative sulfotransferase